MAKAPAIQFYVRDWTTDCNGLSVAAKGAWIQMLCQLHLAPKRGELTKTPAAWARVCGCATDEFSMIVGELTEEEIARVTECNGRITIVSRRFERERKEREAAALRQRKHRAAQDSHENVTTPSASAVSASASATAKEETTAPASDSADNDLPNIAGIERPQGRVVEMSQAARILTDLIDQWNVTKGKRRLCLASGETLEIGIRQKIIERGIPILEIPKFDLKLVEASVSEWRQHCKQLRTSKGRTTRTPSWGLGYLANAWFAQDDTQHDVNAKADAAEAEANETARGLLRTKEAEDDNAAKLAAWGKLQPREQNRILKAHKAKHGALSVKPAAIAEWWQSAAGGKG